MRICWRGKGAGDYDRVLRGKGQNVSVLAARRETRKEKKGGAGGSGREKRNGKGEIKRAICKWKEERREEI